MPITESAMTDIVIGIFHLIEFLDYFKIADPND